MRKPPSAAASEPTPTARSSPELLSKFSWEWFKAGYQRYRFPGLLLAFVALVAVNFGYGILGAINDKGKQVANDVLNPATGPLQVVVKPTTDCLQDESLVPTLDGLQGSPSAPGYDASSGFDPDLYGARVRDWLDAHGAIPVSGYYEMTVQGTSSGVVVLTGMRVVIDHRAPVSGVRVGFFYGGCGGGFAPRYFKVDFASASPRVTAIKAIDPTGAVVPAVTFPFKVSMDDPEVFYVRVLQP